jgi:hypothetical protein
MQSPPVSNKDLQPPAVGGFSFARRISPVLGLYAAFLLPYILPFQPLLHALQGFTAALQCALFNSVSPKNTPIIKRRKFFQKNFSDFVTNVFPHGV